MLDIRPFRAWLRRQAMLVGGTGLLAERIGVKERTLHRWLHEAATVHMDNVDRVLIHEGSTDLRDLYPELYRDEAA